jgi:DNA-binding NtrC family response regulator
MQKQLEPDFSLNGESTSNSAQSIRRMRLLMANLFSEVESLVCGGSKSTDQSGPIETRDSINLYEEIKRFEIALIKSALHRTGGQQVRAAVLLNLNSSTLNAKIRQYNIDVDSLLQLASALSH